MTTAQVFETSVAINNNRPYPNPPRPLFQNEGRCSAFDMEIIFHSYAYKTHFHKKGCVPSLILKVRVFGAQKWPILFRTMFTPGRSYSIYLWNDHWVQTFHKHKNVAKYLVSEKGLFKTAGTCIKLFTTDLYLTCFLLCFHGLHDCIYSRRVIIIFNSS